MSKITSIAISNEPEEIRRSTFICLITLKALSIMTKKVRSVTHRGYKIELTYENPDRVSYRILRANGSLMDGTEDESTGFDVTDLNCIKTAKDSIDYFLDGE